MFSLQIIIAIMALFLVVGLANIADAILLVVAALVVAIGAVFAVAVAFFAIVSCCTRFSCRRRDDVAIDKPSPSPSPSTASDCDSDSGDDYKYAPTPLSQDAYLLKCKTFDQWIDLSRLYGRQRPLGHNAPNPQHQHNFTPFEPISRLTTTQPLARPLPPFSYGSYSSNWTNYGVFARKTAERKARVLIEREEEAYWADRHWNDQCDQQLHLEIAEAEERKSPGTQRNQLSARKTRSGRVWLKLNNHI